MRFIGIDFSLTCPAITILHEDGLFTNGHCHYLTNIKKYASKFSNISGNLHEPYKNNIHRYENIALWALKLIKPNDICYIEDYSLASIGKTFNIAEATGILKYLLYTFDISITPIPPSQIKKFATGKGNADKNKMYDAWHNKENINLCSLFMADKLKSPITDIVDSYWVALYARENCTL